MAAPCPSAERPGFALLAGSEAVARGILISVFPLVMYKALEDAAVVSEVYFVIGLLSLVTGLMVPFVSRYMPRRWVYTIGASFFVIGSLLAIVGSPPAIVAGLLLTTLATVITFVCFNAYVLDYIAKIQLGRCETSGCSQCAGWTGGPALGVILYRWWEPAPFLVGAVATFVMIAIFLVMRLGNGRMITKSRAPPINPLASCCVLPPNRVCLRVAVAVIRSCGWWVYVVYLPMFAIEAGLGDQLGGIALSMSNSALFLTPLMLRWMQRRSIRKAVLTGFFASGLLFTSASLASSYPWVSVEA